MRHRLHHRKLNRTSEHRTALMRNMAQSLIEHGRITTTLAKAKNLRPYIERLVTMAVRSRKLSGERDHAGALRLRRGIEKTLGDRGIVPKDHRETYSAMSDAQRAKTMRMASGRRYRTGEPKGRLAFTAESVIHRLIESVAPRYVDRPGGYTRLIRLADRRIGDHSQLAMLQFVGDEEAPVTVTKPERTARKRRADGRYALAAKCAKSWAKRSSVAKDDAGPAAEDASPNASDASTTVGEGDEPTTTEA